MSPSPPFSHYSQSPLYPTIGTPILLRRVEQSFYDDVYLDKVTHKLTHNDGWTATSTNPEVAKRAEVDSSYFLLQDK